MSDSPNREREIFFAALDCASPAARALHLERACAGDAALRVRVEALLRAHAAAGGFLDEQKIVEPAAALVAEVGDGEFPDARIGRYKLLEQIGEGGFGVVYMAEQQEPVRRRVALKIIKLGMDTRAVVARFEAERQALAMMDHPNIARVLDGGATETGRPYFVMELVRGVPIGTFCDERRLMTRERIELFMQVCAAVQHAHQKGVIHRDLKPSNILVTMHDDRPVPKVIDFGIAKATEHRLTDKTLFTRFHQFVGTPVYMSPEQIGISGLDVDTRSDIYSLGVLLYELLTGHTPFDSSALLKAGLEEIQRTIRESDPPSPSHRLASLTRDQQTTTAQRRRMDPASLTSELRGDLDRIVMKCLEKDRARRYETASALATDLSRHLNHEPVLARPDAIGYRTAKFVRRHRTSVAFGSVVLLALIAGFISTVVQAQRATRHAARAEAERRRAGEQRDFALRQLSRAEAINDLNSFLLWDAAPSGKPFTAVELLDRAESIMNREYAETVENRAEILTVLGRQYVSANEITKARALLERACELSRTTSDRSVRAKAAAALGDAIALAGDLKRGEQLIQEALAELGDDPNYALPRVFCLDRGSHVAGLGGDGKKAIERMEEALRILRETKQGSTLRELSMSMGLADAYRAAGRATEAAAAFEAAFARLAGLGRDETTRAATLLNNWAVSLMNLGRMLESERLFRRAIAIRTADGTEQNTPTAVLNNLAGVMVQLQRFDEAADFAERALAKARDAGDEVGVGYALFSRELIERGRGQLDRATETLAELEARWKATMPATFIGPARIAIERAFVAAARGDGTTAMAEAERGRSLAEVSAQRAQYLPFAFRCRAEVHARFARWDQARADAEKAIALWHEAFGPDALSCWIGRMTMTLGRVLAAQGDSAAARSTFATARKNLEATLGADHPLTREAAQQAN